MRSKKKHALQFGKVAMRYFPECNYKNALRHFRDEIVKTRGLLEALTEIGYPPQPAYLDTKADEGDRGLSGRTLTNGKRRR